MIGSTSLVMEKILTISLVILTVLFAVIAFVLVVAGGVSALRIISGKGEWSEANKKQATFWMKKLPFIIKFLFVAIAVVAFALSVVRTK